MQTTAIGTVAKSLPQNKVILLNLLISNSYIPYTDLHKIAGKNEQKGNKPFLIFAYMHGFRPFDG